jgi:membrane protease subunit (stomatin/prohibitin family)
MNMPLQLPDPNVQTEFTNPANGEVWIYENGVWQIKPDDPITFAQNPPQSALELQIDALRLEINSLQNDIISLKAELASASLNNFLILE